VFDPYWPLVAPEGNEMGQGPTLVYGQNGRVYLLDGGRAHVIQTATDITTYQGANLPAIGGPTQGGRELTTPEEAAFVADFPAGNPAVTVNTPPLTLPTLTATITPV